MEMVKEWSNNTLQTRVYSWVHPLKELVETPPLESNTKNYQAEASADQAWGLLTPQVQVAAIAHVEVYIDDFIVVVQGGPTKSTHIMRHLLQSIHELFRPNNCLCIDIEYPISLNNLFKLYTN